MKKVLKRIAAGLLIAALAAGMLAGCGSPSSSAAPAADSASTAAPATPAEPESKQITFPLAEPAELTIAAADLGSASLADNLPVWQEIERRTNVKINWDVTVSAQYVEVMKLRVGAGATNLPDIMLLPNGLSLAELGSQGTILPLEDYLEDNGQNILAAFDQFPTMRALTSADGHFYSVNSLNEAAYFSPYGFIVRKDWLDRVNLDIPTSIEEWETVLRAFRDEDANGNGNPNDEVPYSAGGTVWYTTYWGNAWGLHMIQSSGWYPDANGQMQYEYLSDNAKAWLTWLHGMYEEGLIDPEFMTLGDEAKMFEKVARDEVGVFTANPSNIPTLLSALQAYGATDAELVAVAPPKGPVAQATEVIGDMAKDGYVVTSSCKNPELAVAFINYLLSDEGKELLNFGIEGETYTKNSDGTYTFTDVVTNDPNGRSPKEVLESYGCWQDGPTMKMEAREAALLFGYPESVRQNIIEYSEAARPFATPGLSLPAETAEESESISGVKGNLSTYIYEMCGKFVVGTADLENDWDSYLAGAEDLRVKDLQAVRQAQYERLMKNA